jgi:endo-alpha-1,4-polygalactosaminidase (GH114 family)
MSQNRRKPKKTESEGVKQEINIPESKAPISEEVVEQLPCYCNNEHEKLVKAYNEQGTYITGLESKIEVLKREAQSRTDFIKHLENSISVKEDALNLSREKADRYSKELSKSNSFGKWLYGINY